MFIRIGPEELGRKLIGTGLSEYDEENFFEHKCLMIRTIQGMLEIGSEFNLVPLIFIKLTGPFPRQENN